MKLQSLKMFKTTKDMFYKQFEFFANWQGRIWGFVNLVLYFISVCGTWLCLLIQEGIQDGYQMIYTALYFRSLSALLSKYVF